MTLKIEYTVDNSSNLMGFWAAFLFCKETLKNDKLYVTRKR